MQELGAKFDILDIPADMAEEAAEWREKLIEAVVEVDDAALEAYMDVSHAHALLLFPYSLT